MTTEREARLTNDFGCFLLGPEYWMYESAGMPAIDRPLLMSSTHVQLMVERIWGAHWRWGRTPEAAMWSSVVGPWEISPPVNAGELAVWLVALRLWPDMAEHFGPVSTFFEWWAERELGLPRGTIELVPQCSSR